MSFDPGAVTHNTSGVGDLVDMPLQAQSGYAGPPQWGQYYQRPANPGSFRQGSFVYSVALGIGIGIGATLAFPGAVAFAIGLVPLALWLIWFVVIDGVRWCFAKVRMAYDVARYNRKVRAAAKAPRVKKDIEGAIKADSRRLIDKVSVQRVEGTPVSDDARTAIVKSGKIAPAHVVKGADPIADLLDPKSTTPNLIRLLGGLTDPSGLGYSVGISCVRSGHHDDSAGYGGHWAGLSVDVTEINGKRVPDNPAETKQFVLNAITKDPFVARIGLGPALADDADIGTAATSANIQVFRDAASHVHLGAK